MNEKIRLLLTLKEIVEAQEEDLALGRVLLKVASCSLKFKSFPDLCKTL